METEGRFFLFCDLENQRLSKEVKTHDSLLHMDKPNPAATCSGNSSECCKYSEKADLMISRSCKTEGFLT